MPIEVGEELAELLRDTPEIEKISGKKAYEIQCAERHTHAASREKYGILRLRMEPRCYGRACNLDVPLCKRVWRIPCIVESIKRNERLSKHAKKIQLSKVNIYI